MALPVRPGDAYDLATGPARVTIQGDEGRGTHRTEVAVVHGAFGGDAAVARGIASSRGTNRAYGSRSLSP